MPMVDSLLKNTGTDIKDIDAFACAIGPGSFTGLRIGIAAVKGMALSLKKPCIAVSTLEAIAYGGIGHEGSVICAVMDARCNQVYNALFRVENSSLKRITDDRAITIDELKNELEPCGTVYIFGDGTSVAYNGMSEIHDRIILPPAFTRYQHASCVAMIAHEKLLRGDTVSYSDIRPVYLRLPQAERELKSRMNNKITEVNQK